MADFSYQPLRGISYTPVSYGYRSATPLRGASNKTFLGFLAVLGILLSGIGLIAGIITSAPWAAGIFVVGMLLFYVAGRLAQRSFRQSQSKWSSIT
jgi:4-hydroxybenzoate polyprenyltransferase